MSLLPINRRRRDHKANVFDICTYIRSVSAKQRAAINGVPYVKRVQAQNRSMEDCNRLIARLGSATGRAGKVTDKHGNPQSALAVEKRGTDVFSGVPYRFRPRGTAGRA